MFCPASPWFSASCCRDGPLAVIQAASGPGASEVPLMFVGVATAHTCAQSTSHACTSLGRHRNTTRPSQSSSHGSVRPHLAVTYVRPLEFLALKKQGSSSTTCATFLVLVDRDGSFRNWSVYQNWNPRLCQSSWTSAGCNGSTSSCPHFRREIRREKIWNFDYLAAAKMFKTTTDILGLSGITKRVKVEPASIECAVPELCGKCKDEFR